MFHSVRIFHMTNRCPQNRFVVVPHRALHRRTASQKNPWTCLAMWAQPAPEPPPAEPRAACAVQGAPLGRRRPARRQNNRKAPTRAASKEAKDTPQTHTDTHRHTKDTPKTQPVLPCRGNFWPGGLQSPSRHTKSRTPKTRDAIFVTSTFPRPHHSMALSR